MVVIVYMEDEWDRIQRLELYMYAGRPGQESLSEDVTHDCQIGTESELRSQEIYTQRPKVLI